MLRHHAPSLPWILPPNTEQANLPEKLKNKFLLEKKSHTCEQAGAHLRISFWHLLMNFEKLKKSEF